MRRKTVASTYYRVVYDARRELQGLAQCFGLQRNYKIVIHRLLTTMRCGTRVSAMLRLVMQLAVQVKVYFLLLGDAVQGLARCYGL